MLAVAFVAPVYPEFHPGALFRGELAYEVLGCPDCSKAREVAQPGGMVDGVAQHRKLDVRCRLEGAEPFLTLLQPHIEIELVKPILAQLDRKSTRLNSSHGYIS